MTSQIPSQHKAIAYDKPGTASVQYLTVDTPQPGNGDVLVRITHSGVCHSDWGVMTRREGDVGPPAQAGQIGGHEGVGDIVAFGPNTEQSGLKLGDRVGIKWMARVCGSCFPCLASRDGCCSNGTISGYGEPGTFQQYALAPANYVTRIPDELSSELAAPMLCGGITVYAALKKCGAKPGDAVVIMGGTGGLGHLALQMGGRGMGFRMIALDYGDKKEFAEECGAESYIDVSKYDYNDPQFTVDVKKVTPHELGAAAVIVCTGANEAYAAAVSFVRFGGTVVCVGVPEGAPVAIASADPATLISQEISIVGSVVGNRMDAIETMEMAARGVVTTRVTVQPMSTLMDIFDKMNKRQLKGRIVLDLTV
ncbi:Polyketide synthase, enoylreductase [Penicillium expansum]|nr:Polyketide synthase enoylreductase [Penicillium expansum]KGO37806.1 Polyketide synthase, enoylreductase [Penicillium expansum]KGO65370.1 Polyketide synthase, enoylreductase [Penicillium expansum]